MSCLLSKIPDCGLLCDLLWSDPDKDITGWSENDRGVSFTFGPDVVSRFLQKHDMDLICRAHQVVEDGYEFFSKRQLVTLFSAPNYCGEFDNAGAMMSVDESLLCSFQVCELREFWSYQLLTFGSRSSSPPRRSRSSDGDKQAMDYFYRTLRRTGPLAAPAASHSDKQVSGAPASVNLRSSCASRNLAPFRIILLSPGPT